ncbi:hypothetical protein B5C34_06110 [Pacificimonas flava]|uniref:DUF2254 domain-containing protein n=2 Tax=Pacificimonas TaxID=1960290 RepID=A0A219B3Z9_9SPHN|nr:MULTISPECIES: DUF2254 domain-containing protein [Pacificimonas]MBZ6377201.1 DUF2254 domain-containing protein [Pacificimonas aurantium]OWV33077.1 hypothetical protein B5C34_06110 [Pacificimonas flava]
MERYAARLTDWAGQLRSSYGFIPALMCVAAALLALLLLLPPDSWGTAVAGALGLPDAPDADALRELLAMMAGATISTGAVAFSIIVAASVTASSQYGPRLLTNFLADRATQTTLGVFVATFVYAIIVHAAIREERVHGLAGLGAMLLALLSVGALVYFLHHAPAALRINQAVANIGETLLRNIATRFPANCGYPAAPPARPETLWTGTSTPLLAGASGRLSIVDGARLAAIGGRCDVHVRLRVRPGEFVPEGRALADIYGPSPADAERQQMRDQFALAKVRTPSQDNDFLADELVEIALRALSPGINDPVTAAECLDWLGAALGRLAGNEAPHPWRGTKSGDFRVYAEPEGFAEYLAKTFGRIRANASSSVFASEAYLKALATVGVEGGSNARAMSLVREEADHLLFDARLHLMGADLAQVEKARRSFDLAIGAVPAALDKFNRSPEDGA